MTAKDKIRALRRLINTRGVAALIVPSTDPHQSEYVGERWQARKWVSGFTGSNGTLVITRRHAGLWTDGRYFIQAARELRGSGIRLYKSREPGVPTVNEWIVANLKPGATVAFDGSVVSMEAVNEMENAFRSKRLRLRSREDLVGEIWTERPSLPQAPVIDFPHKYAGTSRSEKLNRVRAWLKEKGADGLLLASLDDIAWLFNVRGGDIPHSPVFLAYAWIESKRTTLFVDAVKFPAVLKRRLGAAGVHLAPYDSIRRILKSMNPNTALCLDPRKINQGMADAFPKRVRIIKQTPDVTTILKAEKNAVEQGNWRHAALLDGLALVRFFAWLERALKRGMKISEADAVCRLTAFRSMAPEYRGDSFPAICAYGGNAAMVHYATGTGKPVWLKPRGLLLLDSGGQYFEGTMDTTRTVALGPVSLEARQGYTLVLKGFIAVQKTRFPVGTTGTQIDILARAPLWAHGLNYRHGSGHGVGAYLNVHEGPHGFTPVWNPTPLKPGYVVTIEPGCYAEGKYGIRTENMVLVQPAGTTDYGPFLRFETLTLCPVDTIPVLVDWLGADEKEWLNAYHRHVRQTLSPYLTPPERAWLKRKTRLL